jgi:hypothetical protein
MDNETIKRIKKIFNETVHNTSSPVVSARDVVKYAQENNIDVSKQLNCGKEENV